jgi:hypothetical protein
MVLLSQEKYTSNILKRVGMMNGKPVSTPMIVSEGLSTHNGVVLEPQVATRYQSVVGALQYLTLTRPNLSFLVNKVYQFLHQPTTIHWTTVKRILRYLWFTLKVGFKIDKCYSTPTSAFADANWA